MVGKELILGHLLCQLIILMLFLYYNTEHPNTKDKCALIWYFERSVYECLSATLCSATAQKVRTASFTIYACCLTISFRYVDVKGLRVYVIY